MAWIWWQTESTLPFLVNGISKKMDALMCNKLYPAFLLTRSLQNLSSSSWSNIWSLVIDNFLRFSQPIGRKMLLSVSYFPILIQQIMQWISALMLWHVHFYLEESLLAFISLASCLGWSIFSTCDLQSLGKRGFVNKFYTPGAFLDNDEYGG